MRGMRPPGECAFHHIRYATRTHAADTVITGTYLDGANTRRLLRALATLFNGALSKDVMSRAQRRHPALPWAYLPRKDLAGSGIPCEVKNHPDWVRCTSFHLVD